MQTQAPSVIARLEAFITEELSPPDLEAIYDDMLDDCYSFEKVGGPFAMMSPSRVLRLCDEVWYRCGLNDWADEDYVEVGDKMYGKEEVREKQEEFCDQIRSEILDLETTIEEAESIPDHDPNAGRLPALREQLASLQSDLQIAERHCF